MPPLPDNAHQATIHPTALENNPCSRSISDDDHWLDIGCTFR
ncbi:hypothetical protein N7922_05735 [Kosakonia sp. ML.JS2a]|nr:hypothetical protein [Kosakonia sp. ML.JS2a]UXY12029.1 hypothetical protein N7922_05735 [Kosakonia sp. ML.JS2a]